MSIWDFDISYKILFWILTIICIVSIGGGFLISDTTAGVNFYFRSVNFLTKPLIDYLLEQLKI